jgi:hypothetical protein
LYIVYIFSCFILLSFVLFLFFVLPILPKEKKKRKEKRKYIPDNIRYIYSIQERMSITGYNPATVSTALTAGTYRHVALSISGTVHSLYLDGSMVAQNIAAGNVFASYTSAIPRIYIGCAGDLSYGLTGSIDDFKIWNRTLVATDISAIYWSSYSAPLAITTTATTTERSCCRERRFERRVVRETSRDDRRLCVNQPW